MSEMAKQARAAMKAKAMRLGKDRPLEKVDSSSWTPAELLNADVKTGLRPVSRRAFKKGGKVMGECNAPRADRKPRKSGGKAITADSLINRNVKEANEDREGKKHIGGMKKGGRAKYANEGSVQIKGKPDPRLQQMMGRTSTPEDEEISPAMAARMRGIMDRSAADSAAADREAAEAEAFKARGYKKGGRTKKAAGGAKAAAERMMQQAQDTAGVAGSRMNFQPVAAGKLSPMKAAGAMKKGGMAKKHDDVKADKALIKKMVKPASLRQAHATRGRAKSQADIDAEYAMRGPDEAMQSIIFGGKPPIKTDDMTYSRPTKREFDMQQKMVPSAEMSPDEFYKMQSLGRNAQDYRGTFSAPTESEFAAPMKKGGRAKRKDGGGVFTGEGYPHKIPGVVPGGRTARATGGKTKGKTNINIVIAQGKHPGQPGMMPPGGPMGKPPGGVPVPVPPPGAGPGAGMGAPAGIPMPIPMPVPSAAGATPPAGGLPLPRKSGGRISKVASSYKDMEAGAAGGEGRLQKTDIAKKGKGAPAYKAGGKVYRSYKDMDAGAASGLGRLEKSEIAARKG